MFSHFLRKLGTLATRPDPTAVRGGGLLWHPLPSAGELLPLLPTLLSHPAAVVVKQNLQRTILRIDAPGGTVFVKRSRANTPRAWAREILRPPKARLEFENAVRLRELGIPCGEPLAWAEADSFWPGESAIVTREVAGGVPLDEYLSDSLMSVERRKVAVQLGRLFARMHAAGVAHPDPHPGNLLVQATADGPRFVLLDVHAVRFGRPLTWPEARDNLVLFNRWFQLRASRTDRARFWQAYDTGRPGGVSPLFPTANRGLTPPARLENETSASNRRFWAARDDRYLGSNRQFRKAKGRGVRGHAVRELPDDVVKAWLADPDAVFAQPGVVVLKDSPSATVAIVNGVLFKRFRLKRSTDALKNLLRRSEALRSWVFGHGLLDRHLPTARPLFVAHRYRRGIPREGYVAFEVVPDAVELPAFVASATFTELRTLCETLGRLIRTLHDRGISHRDLKPANILLSGPDRRPVFIDLVGLAVHTDVPAVIRRRDLTRLNAGFVQSAHVSRTVRLRLLLAYLRAWPAVADDWKAWWRAVSAATDRKVLKNLHRGRPLA
jgi:tRNA A-37 threonylcarbamoyl transferase component Bud32